MFEAAWLLVILVLASVAYAAMQGAPWVPTWKRDLARIERLVALKAGERFVELGCGNARVCRHMKRRQPEAIVEGVELSILQLVVGWLQNLFSRTNVTLKLGNVFRHDLSNTDAIYMFLMPATYSRLRPKLEAELRQGSRVVTYAWPIEGWIPTSVDEVDGSPKLYLYTPPF